MTTIEEVEDVVGKLLSDRARVREEGLKLLNSYLEITGSRSFCCLLDEQTVLLQQQERIPSSTWPGVLHALCQCISMEVGLSKKRGPKVSLSKTLRTFVQKAEDFNRSGHKALLLRKMKRLFHHIAEMVQDAPGFVSDYGQILCQLLLDVEYRLCMSKKTYTDLVNFFLGKLKTVAHKDIAEPSTTKEEAFRLALTLLSLVQYPPGDIPDMLRKEIVNGYCDIFSHLRDDGRIAKKLIAALNTTLMNDGLNLGDSVVKLHSSFRHFMVRTWLTTRDWELKDGLVLYLRAQLNLRRIITSKDYGELEELLELIEKELDHTGSFLVGCFRDDKPGCLSRSFRSFFELAASVFFEVGAGRKVLMSSKRRRKETVDAVIKDRLMNGNPLWTSAFSFFIRRFGSELARETLFNWLDGLACSLDRLFTDAISARTFQSSVWILRCLQELSALWVQAASNVGLNEQWEQPSIEDRKLWQSVWDALLRWLPLFNPHPSMIEESFRLLGDLATQGVVPCCTVPPDFWDLQCFTEHPHRNTLYFVAMYFARYQDQVVSGDALFLRKTLLRWASTYLDSLVNYVGIVKTKVSLDDWVAPKVFTAAVLIICTGSYKLSLDDRYLTTRDSLHADLDDWTEPDEHDRGVEASLATLDWSKRIFTFSKVHKVGKDILKLETRFNAIPFSASDQLLQKLLDIFQEKVKKALDSNDLSTLLKMSTILVYFLCGVMYSGHRRGQLFSDWVFQEKVRTSIEGLLDHFITLVNGLITVLEDQTSEPTEKTSVTVADIAQQLSSTTASNMNELVGVFVGSGFTCQGSGLCSRLQGLLGLVDKLYLAVIAFSQSAHRAENMRNETNILGVGCMSSVSHDDTLSARILDADLDVSTDATMANVGPVCSSADPSLGIINITFAVSSSCQWRQNCISMIFSLGELFSELAYEKLTHLLLIEKNEKLHNEIFRSVCRSVTSCSLVYLPDLVEMMKFLLRRSCECEQNCAELLTTIDALLSRLLSFRRTDPSNDLPEMFQNVLAEIAKIVEDIADMSLLLWTNRSKLAENISSLVLLDPGIPQTLIEKLIVLLHDQEYQVRLFLSRLIPILFETWSAHVDLFQDVCSNFGMILPMATKFKLTSATDTCRIVAEEGTVGQTIILTLGEIATSSDVVEPEAVFMIIGHAALNPSHRPLAAIVLDKLSHCLGYPDRFKCLGHLAGGIFSRWVRAKMPLSALVEMREVFFGKIDPKKFIQDCNPFLLPHLLLQGHGDELMWLAKANSVPVPQLLRENFAFIFASLLPLHCIHVQPDSDKAAQVLQGSMLASAELSEDERDRLIKRHMVSIVNIIFSFCSSSEDPEIPFYSKAAVTFAVRTVVDGFMETDDISQDGSVIDKMHVFRSDRVFKLLLQAHHQIDSAYHSRHRRHYLERLGAIIEVIRNRILVPSTWRYLVLLILDSIEFDELQIRCCELLGEVIDRLEHLPSERAAWMLGSQLQSIVSKLVSCCLNFHAKGSSVIKVPTLQNKMSSSNEKMKRFSSAVALLNRVSTDADHSLYPHIKELHPFPASPVFKKMEAFRLELRSGITLEDEFLEFLMKANDVSPSLRVKSFQWLCHQLQNAKAKLCSIVRGKCRSDASSISGTKVIAAVWKLVKLCTEHDDEDFYTLVGDFLASVGIDDTNAVSFQCREALENSQSLIPCNSKHDSGKSTSSNVELEQEVGDELCTKILLYLCTYLLDKDVYIIELTVDSLKGILATETGKRVFKTLNEKERAYMEAFSNGVNPQLVEDMLEKWNMIMAQKAMVLEDPHLWKTSGKSYKTWICNLTYSLIQCTHDPILKLCQELVLQKETLAELLFPNVLMCLSKKVNLDTDVYRQLTDRVQKYIFNATNKSIRAIQLWLEALNFLRQAYVMSKLRVVPLATKRDAAKQGRKSFESEEKCQVSISSANSDHIQIGISEDEEQRYVSPITWPKVYWLQIDYLLTSNAAQRCGAYFTSTLYVEQWCEENFGHLALGEPDFSSDSLPWHMELLLNVNTRINEPDGVYGVIRSHKVISQLRMHEHEGNWNKALENYDRLLRTMPLFTDEEIDAKRKISSTGRLERLHFMKGLLRSLHQMGCSHVSEMYCHGLVKEQVGIENDNEFKELQSEAAWRSGSWDLNFSASTSLEDNSYPGGEFNMNFNANLHSCFRYLVDGDEQMFDVQIKKSKKELVTFLAYNSLESAQTVHPTIIRLQILKALSQAWGMRWPTIDSNISLPDFSESSTRTSGAPVIPSKDQMINIASYWDEILKQTHSNYDLLEPAGTFFSVLLQVLGQKDFLMNHLLKFATLARKAGMLNQAATAVHQLRFLFQEKTILAEHSVAQTLPAEPECLPWCTSVRLEEAKILWAQGQHEMAVNLVKYILQTCNIERKLASVYCLAGKWLAETRSASSRTILEGYLQKAVELAKEMNNSPKQKCKTYYHLAHYTDALYRSYEDQLTSNAWQSALRLRQHKARELEALIKRLKNVSKDEKRDYTLKALELQKQLSMDNEQAQRLQDDKENFLMIALESYRNCLTTSNKFDIRVVFRIISLWFNLSSKDMVNTSMFETIKVVQSFKFLPLMYQIASRLSTSKDAQAQINFQSAVTFLVKKMAIEHPYHTLYQLLALAKGDHVKDKQRSKSAFVVDLEKKAAAENLLNELLAYHPTVIQQMKQMIEMYIKLAELETKKEDTNKRLPVPRDIRSIRQLEQVPVITAPLSVDPSCQYKPGTFPYFKGLSDRIIVMNGINAPKVIECLGSDGCKYRQLAKSGNDDLRQDAVMEQLFGLVNELLQDHPETRRRQLRIRTYKVIPFTPSAGVLEWVDGTIPLGEYLLGSNRTGGAHARYGYGDWTFMKCRDYMSAETDKRKAFQTVCNHFRPVMHFFFLERFGQPADWFEKRLAYTRSVATSSMVGYIVGLGDRHSMNILIDQASAEVVHIDFGVAFEQGLMLKTPERVPFRLTRDIVDGMGVSGIEGVFRRCCEATLSVMRTNKEALLTIIEVFIHDPLYKWALSPLKALQRQQETDVLDDDESSEANGSPENLEGNKDAARALLRLKQKLDGYEQGEMRSLQGQVQQLIHDAQDPEHLAQMFPGWGAWL